MKYHIKKYHYQQHESKVGKGPFNSPFPLLLNELVDQFGPQPPIQPLVDYFTFRLSLDPALDGPF